jgi:tetratricopeptide (TPR) repeat protein
MAALLECGNCYFKLRDYNSAIIRYEYAKQAFLDYMSDSANDVFILSRENLRNYTLNGLLLQIELGIARCYVTKKLYIDADGIYCGAQLVLDTTFQQESLKGLALRIDYLTTVGKTYYAQRKYKESISLYMEALKFSKRIKDSQSEAFICSQLANVFFSLGDYETANKYYTLFEQEFRIFQFLGHEAIIIYINWSKTNRKLKKYTKARSTRNKAEFFRITLNRNLNQMRWMKRFQFERRKLDFKVRISNVALRKAYSAWDRIEGYIHRAYESIRVCLFDILRLSAFLVVLPVVLLGLPIILLITIYETVTEEKS